MRKGLVLIVVLAFTTILVVGCGSGVSEDKPITEIQKEAQELSVAHLKAVVAKYQKAIEAKKPELMALQAQLRKIPLTQMMGEDAAGIKKEISAVANSIKALTDRMKAYKVALNKKS